MSKVHLQFHADPEELFGLAGMWAEQDGYVLTAEQFFPEYSAVVAKHRVESLAELDIGRLDRLAFTRTAPELPVISEQDFSERNSNALFILVGTRTADALRLSAMGGLTDDQELLKRWRQLVKKCKQSMHRGAVVRNPHTARTAHVRHHLHTVGAHELARSGVKMLALAGWNEFEFDDLAEARRP